MDLNNLVIYPIHLRVYVCVCVWGGGGWGWGVGVVGCGVGCVVCGMGGVCVYVWTTPEQAKLSCLIHHKIFHVTLMVWMYVATIVWACEKWSKMTN